MTDKQEIIIDGVDVSGCCSLELDCNVYYCNEYNRNVHCDNNPNCDYKRLQRKTAECEELKKILSYPKYTNEFAYDELLKLSKEELIKNVIESHQHGESVTQCVYKPLKEENTNYKQALDEIEKYCSQNRYSGWVDIEGILDIISKAKGEENADIQP